MITSDEPTLSDQLDRQELLKEAGETIATCTPPQVFGVHGDWGLGKTSLLHQLQDYLTGECPQHAEDDVEQAALCRGAHKHVTVVWFEAWRYQHEDVPVVALLHEIRAQLDWRWKFVEKSKKI